MKGKNLEHFRDALRQNRDALLAWLESDVKDKSIHLGGSEETDVFRLVSELKEALERVDSGEFGKCEVCHGDVETEQLEYDFTSCICLTHYSEAQLRNLERELELVSKVQRDLLPCSVPNLPGVQIAAKTLAARIVGGDYYDFFHFRNGASGLAIADVMDKGLPASILMSNLQASLRILGPESDGLDSLAFRVNKLFRRNLQLIKFISLFLAAIDLEAKTLEYCNAGHHPPLWWQAKTRSVHWLDPTGPAIGLTPEPQYLSEKVRFNSGDLFVFYTDGLVEARNRTGSEFGEERMLAVIDECLNNSSQELLDNLLGRARIFADKFHDDVTLVVLKIA